MHNPAGNLMIIEDDDDTRAMLEFILGRAGYGLYMAADGQAALQRIETADPPDLVLLDILMPYHDGFEVLEAIKAKPGWSAVPVIMLTSKEDEDNIVRGFAEGIADYVTKPFKPAELVARIQRTLHK